jgi:hypothetical protein
MPMRFKAYLDPRKVDFRESEGKSCAFQWQPICSSRDSTRETERERRRATLHIFACLKVGFVGVRVINYLNNPPTNTAAAGEGQDIGSRRVEGLDQHTVGCARLEGREVPVRRGTRKQSAPFLKVRRRGRTCTSRIVTHAAL